MPLVTRPIRRRRTAWSARIGSRPRTPRCRSSTTTRCNSKAVQDFLRDGQVSVDVFAITRGAAAQRGCRRPRGAARAALVEHLRGRRGVGAFGAAQAVSTLRRRKCVGRSTRCRCAVRRGESVRVEVVVRTRKVGHFFPGGTVDAFDVWVELEAVDDQRPRAAAQRRAGRRQRPGRPGRALLPQPAARRARQPDQQAERLDDAIGRLRAAGPARRRRHDPLPPADSAGCGRQDLLRAKVNYRKFAWWNTQWAYAGVRDPTSTHSRRRRRPRRWPLGVHRRYLAGVRRDQGDPRYSDHRHGRGDSVARGRGDERAAAAGPAAFLDASVRERWNDYGIGLLLQGDLKAAEAAFRKVTEMDPGYADGWVNVGARTRCRKATGRRARRCSSRRWRSTPRPRQDALLPRHRAEERSGATTRRCASAQAAAQYPRDRVVLNQIGRVLFLQRRFDEAIASFREVLRDRSRRSAGALQPDAVLPGPRRHDAGRARAALYTRFKADDRRRPSPARTALNA